MCLSFHKVFCNVRQTLLAKDMIVSDKRMVFHESKVAPRISFLFVLDR